MILDSPLSNQRLWGTWWRAWTFTNSTLKTVSLLLYLHNIPFILRGLKYQASYEIARIVGSVDKLHYWTIYNCNSSLFHYLKKISSAHTALVALSS